jgi:hypothetical protein
MLARPELVNASPRFVKTAVRRLMRVDVYDYEVRRRLNPYVGTPHELEYDAGSECTVGISYEPAHYHQYYQSACIDLGISYKVIDLFRSDWTTVLAEARTNVLMVWPPCTESMHKEMTDERSRCIHQYLGVQVYPDPEAIYLFDSKLRVRDWLMANGFEIPRTSCFFRLPEVDDFLRRCDYPVVFKALRGGVSSGVVICRSRRQAFGLAKRCFGTGLVTPAGGPRGRQLGVVLFQEYLPDVRELRMIRVGDSYLAVEKVRRGDFHSGSHVQRWIEPDRRFLDLTRALTDKAGFRSMNVDFFLTTDGRGLVNELHAVFGPVYAEGTSGGRFLYEPAGDSWRFESGSYARSYCCNLRVMDALRLCGYRGAFRMDWVHEDPSELASTAETSCSQHR